MSALQPWPVTALRPCERHVVEPVDTPPIPRGRGCCSQSFYCLAYMPHPFRTNTCRMWHVGRTETALTIEPTPGHIEHSPHLVDLCG